MSRTTLMGAAALVLCLPVFLGVEECPSPVEAPEVEATAHIEMIYANLMPEVPPDPVYGSFTLTFVNTGTVEVTLDPVFTAILVSTDFTWKGRGSIDQLTDNIVSLSPGASITVPYQKAADWGYGGDFPCGKKVTATVDVTGTSPGGDLFVSVESDTALFQCVF